MSTPKLIRSSNHHTSKPLRGASHSGYRKIPQGFWKNWKTPRGVKLTPFVFSRVTIPFYLCLNPPNTQAPRYFDKPQHSRRVYDFLPLIHDTLFAFIFLTPAIFDVFICLRAAGYLQMDLWEIFWLKNYAGQWLCGKGIGPGSEGRRFDSRDHRLSNSYYGQATNALVSLFTKQYKLVPAIASGLGVRKCEH